MLFLITCILHMNLCAISFNRTQDLHFAKNSEKIVTTLPPSNLCSRQLYIYNLVKQVYCMQNFVWFYATGSKIKLPEEFWGKLNSSAPYWAIYTQIASLLFLMIYILYINFVEFCPLETQISVFQKFWKKWNYSANCWAIFTKYW